MKILLLLCLALPALGSDVQQLIVGGNSAFIANHPHQLSLRVNGVHSCGASLISSTQAVTAAHCGGGALAIYTLLGGTRDRTDTLCWSCVLRPISYMIRHPGWNFTASGFPNDIAVLGFLAVLNNSNVQPISLATPSNGNYAGRVCMITGWGRTAGPNSGLPSILQQAEMIVLTNQDCANQWYPYSINNGHICVKNSTAGACGGDSGGPLVCDKILIGATSWGDSQCDPYFPSVYTRISYFYNWITEQQTLNDRIWN